MEPVTTLTTAILAAIAAGAASGATETETAIWWKRLTN
jgi:hypothetical protein